METFYSNGKLLLTGEYLVLDGAKSLAVPTKCGQDLIVKPIKEPKLVWESFTNTNQCWLQVEFDLPKLRLVNATFFSDTEGGADQVAETLFGILREARKLNPEFLTNEGGFLVQTHLTFPQAWGLGSSSTLINNIGQWAGVDAFELLQNSFGGSGYDIACAQNDTPIVYQLNNRKPKVTPVGFTPDFRDQLYFIYLNKKQNSREGIKKYRTFEGELTSYIKDISEITAMMITQTSLSDFEKLLKEHEFLISKIIKETPVQEQLFSDYFGQVKSLGAWGGDFVLATGNEDTQSYFRKKGFETVVPYKELIL